MARLLPLLLLLPCVLCQGVPGTFEEPGELELVEGALLTTLGTLAKEWRVTFDFLPTEYIPGDPASGGATSILRLTNTVGNFGNHGDRIPAIFIVKDQGLLIFTSINSNPNFEKQLKLPPVGEWTRLEAGQREEGGKFTFYFSVNGTELVTVRNSKPRDFYDVKVFASDTFYTAQPGSIRNLVVETKLEDCGVKKRWADGTCMTSCREECRGRQVNPPDAPSTTSGQGIIERLSDFTSSIPIETIVGASAGGGFLIILSIVLTVVCCRKRAEPAREESAVEVWESAKPDSPYYDQGDYDEMDHNKTGEPKKNREERKEEATDYEMDRAGTYLEL